MTDVNYPLLELIDSSYTRWNTQPLPVPAGISNRLQWLHLHAPYSLIAHNTNQDPQFIYANLKAIESFGYPADILLGLPSRLSTAVSDQPVRQQMLNTVKQHGIARNYSGPRINADGNVFMIYDGAVWQVTDAAADVIGQAALFSTSTHC